MLSRTPLAETTACHLRERLASGEWRDKLPGVMALSGELGVSKQIVRQALLVLEHEGVLSGAGNGRARRIAASASAAVSRPLRISILPGEFLPKDNAFSQHLLLSARLDIEAAGHSCLITGESLQSLRHSPRRVLQLIRREVSDAWIVYGAARNVLEALDGLSTPVYALGGNTTGLRLAGSRTDLSPAIRESVGRLAALGHRRIVAISPPFWRNPVRGPNAQTFLDSLAAHGIPAGDYNLPDWEPGEAGFEALLESLFKVTPPTALLVVEPLHAVHILGMLMRRRLRVPQDVSLLSMLSDPVLEWFQPRMAHFGWSSSLHLRHIRRWVSRLSRGGTFVSQKHFPASLEQTESLGPCPG